MLAPVIVDLGPDVAPPAIEIVLDACNEVIQNGVCLPEGAAHAEAARATAIARPDESVLSVHIEVQLGPSGEGPWLVRDLQFGARDPTAERWRSVGLAIATLVGEGEQRQAEQATAEGTEAAAPREAAPETPAPVSAAPAAPASASRAEATPSRSVVSSEDRETSGAGPPWAPLFIGIGVLAGPGFDDGVWRLGGSARASWTFPEGFQLVTSADYSWRASTSEFTASWLSLQAGVGYRLRLSERASVAVDLRGGAQQLRTAARARGETTSRVSWNPAVALGIDGRWLVGAGVGIWAAADAQTIGRETRLFVAPERSIVTSPLVGGSAVLGLGWWLP
jgi:hypothetical protein